MSQGKLRSRIGKLLPTDREITKNGEIYSPIFVAEQFNNTIMKRTFLTWMLCVTSLLSGYAATKSRADLRVESRFLTDKMAYELNLSTSQCNDVFEINYDFLCGVSGLMELAIAGNESAVDRYYMYLDMRNDDLRWVLSSRQYNRFMQTEYFFRPIYVNAGRWALRVCVVYTNHNHFYFPRPHHYLTYRGKHWRTHHRDVSFYKGRHNLTHFAGSYRIRGSKNFRDRWHADFGKRPAHPSRRPSPPAGRPHKPSVSPHPGKPDKPDKPGRPSHGQVRPARPSRPQGTERPGREVRPSRRPEQSRKAEPQRRGGQEERRQTFRT